VTYTVTGSIDLLAGGTLINTATVTAPAAVTDPNSSNNTATDSDSIKPLTRGFLAVGADTSKNGKPKVNVYSAAGILTESFLAYPATYHGGVRVAMGDVNGDGIDDVITAPGRSASPVIKVWDGATLTDNILGNATELTAYRIQAYATSFTG